MLTHLPPKPRVVGPRRTFAIVASSYNAKYVQGLVDHCAREIESLAPTANIILRQVPGAFEIPVLVQEIALKGTVHAIVALGVVIEGDTYHADLICRTVTQSLMDTALRHRVPVVHEVLYLKDEAQAQARCLDREHNRGVEAARAAIEIAQTVSEMKERVKL